MTAPNVRRLQSFGVTARDATAAAEQRRRQVLEERKCAWPYYHVFPPPNSDTFHQINSPAVQVPVLGATVEVLSYQVPDGMRAILQAIVQNYLGASTFSAGDLLWTVTTNEPSGIVDVQGAPEQGLIATPVQLGSFLFGVQWEFKRAYEFAPNTVIRSICKNATGNIPAGAGNFLVSGFFGYLIPDVEAGRT